MTVVKLGFILTLIDIISQSDKVGFLLKQFENADKLIGVICASPIALEAHKICVNRQITSYPSMETKLSSYKYSKNRVVVDGNLITSRGPGTAFEFALALVSNLTTDNKAKEVGTGMLL